MSHIDPQPTGASPRPSEIPWLKPKLLLFPAATLPERNFVNVLTSRRSIRRLEPAAIWEVAAVVRLALKADFVGTSHNAGRKRKRMVSAGALHPVRCAIVGQEDGLLVYDDELDRFYSVECRDPGSLVAFKSKCETVLPAARGHVLALIADVSTVSTVYSNAESLIWRDGGAVLQTLALVSEAFALGFCPMGVLGQEVADALLPSGHSFLGVGVAMIGRTATRSTGS